MQADARRYPLLDADFTDSPNLFGCPTAYRESLPYPSLINKGGHGRVRDETNKQQIVGLLAKADLHRSESDFISVCDIDN